MARGATLKRLNQPLESELLGQGGSHDDGSGVPTPRVPVLATPLEQDAYRQQLQRDLSDFAHPDFANEITPVVDVRDLFDSEEDFEAAFPEGWGQPPLPAFPRGRPGVPEVDLDGLLDAAESRRNADLAAPWTHPTFGATAELVVRGALRPTEDPDASEPNPLPGSGSMWSTMRPPPLSSGDHETDAERTSTDSLEPTGLGTSASWRASHGPLTPPPSALPASCADDDEPPTPLLLTRVRSSPPSPPLPSGSSIAPVYYTDAPVPPQGDPASDRGASTGPFRRVPAWLPPLVSAAVASALTLVAVGWSFGRTAPTDPVATSDSMSAESLLASAASPATGARSPEPNGSRPDFDRAGAEAALERAAAQAASCVTSDAPRAIDVKVTFGPQGTVSRALVLDSGLLGTPQGVCVTRAFHRARITPFSGSPQTLARSVFPRSSARHDSPAAQRN